MIKPKREFTISPSNPNMVTDDPYDIDLGVIKNRVVNDEWIPWQQNNPQTKIATAMANALPQVMHNIPTAIATTFAPHMLFAGWEYQATAKATASAHPLAKWFAYTPSFFIEDANGIILKDLSFESLFPGRKSVVQKLTAINNLDNEMTMTLTPGASFNQMGDGLDTYLSHYLSIDGVNYSTGPLELVIPSLGELNFYTYWQPPGMAEIGIKEWLLDLSLEGVPSLEGWGYVNYFPVYPTGAINQPYTLDEPVKVDYIPGLMDYEFKDIRFALEDHTVLKHDIIEKIDGVHAYFAVQLPGIPGNTIPLDISSWTEDKPVGTITINEETVSFNIGTHVNADWSIGELENAPIVYTPIPDPDDGYYEYKVKISDYGPSNRKYVGLMLYKDRDNVYLFGQYVANQIKVEKIINDVQHVDIGSVSNTTIPLWLKIVKRGSIISFYYSYDDIEYNLVTNVEEEFDPTHVGLFAKAWGYHTALDVSFDDFQFNTLDFEKEFKVYVYCGNKDVEDESDESINQLHNTFLGTELNPDVWDINATGYMDYEVNGHLTLTDIIVYPYTYINGHPYDIGNQFQHKGWKPKQQFNIEWKLRMINCPNLAGICIGQVFAGLIRNDNTLIVFGGWEDNSGLGTRTLSFYNTEGIWSNVASGWNGEGTGRITKDNWVNEDRFNLKRDGNDISVYVNDVKIADTTIESDIYRLAVVGGIHSGDLALWNSIRMFYLCEEEFVGQDLPAPVVGEVEPQWINIYPLPVKADILFQSRELPNTTPQQRFTAKIGGVLHQ